MNAQKEALKKLSEFIRERKLRSEQIKKRRDHIKKTKAGQGRRKK